MGSGEPPALVYDGHRGPVWDLAFDAAHLATAGADRVIRLWPAPAALLGRAGPLAERPPRLAP
jgi:hypothetical protein